jgi:hypothetical protein
MSAVRDHLGLLAIAMAIGYVVFAILGFWTWDRWLQLASLGVLAVICTRIFAPVYFGWRDPKDDAGRRTRQ